MITQQERLRSIAASIRTKPTPLSDFIPLLNQSADHIDKLEAEVERLRKDAERRQMTDEQRDELLLSIGTTGKRQVWFTRAEVKRAIDAAMKVTP